MGQFGPWSIDSSPPSYSRNLTGIMHDGAALWSHGVRSSADPLRTVAITSSIHPRLSSVINSQTTPTEFPDQSVSYPYQFPILLFLPCPRTPQRKIASHQNAERGLQLHDPTAGLHGGNLLSKPRHGELHSHSRWKHRLCRHLPVGTCFAAWAMSMVPNLDLYDWNGLWPRLRSPWLCRARLDALQDLRDEPVLSVRQTGYVTSYGFLFSDLLADLLQKLGTSSASRLAQPSCPPLFT